MVVYVDLVFIINFIFDFSLLTTTDLLLKRNAKYSRLALGSLVGELSMITLFLSFNRIENFLFKIVLSLLMCLATFSHKGTKYTLMNTVYLYLVGMILGGFEYYLYNEFQVTGLGIKYLIVLFLSPVILFLYYKLSKRYKKDYSIRHKVEIKYKDKVFDGIGYLDSGNKLVSPISGNPIILVEKRFIDNADLPLTPIPYNALNYHGLLYSFKPKTLKVDEKEYKNVLVGLSEVDFNIDGVNVLLNARMEDL